MAAGLGFEPRQNESESFVLPLHNPATPITLDIIALIIIISNSKFVPSVALKQQLLFNFFWVIVIFLYNNNKLNVMIHT